MDLIERYLHAVKFWLPKAERDDILAELSEDIRLQIEEREKELGRPLDDGEVAAILKRRGDPGSVASRYLPRRCHLDLCGDRAERSNAPGQSPLDWDPLKLPPVMPRDRVARTIALSEVVSGMAWPLDGSGWLGSGSPLISAKRDGFWRRSGVRSSGRNWRCFWARRRWVRSA